MEVVYLKQSDATSAVGVSQTVFQNRVKPTLKMEVRDGKKLYAVPIEKMTQTARDFYSDKIEEVEAQEEGIEDILGNIDFSTMPGGEGDLTVLQEARLKKILKETDYLDQKILNKKE